MKKRAPIVASIATAGALLLSSCGSGGGDPSESAQGAETNADGFAVNTGAPVEGGTIRVLQPADFSHLDPAMGNDGGVNNFYRLIYRQLTTYANKPGESTPELVPDLATDLGTPNEDKTKWTFTLKDGIKYQDGTEILAKDLKYALERSMDPDVRLGTDFHIQYIKGAKDYDGIYQDPDGLESVKVIDDKTITFVMAKPTAAFPEIAAMQVFTPFPKDSLENANSVNEDPIASGPYQIKDYVRGSKLTLKRNSEWNVDTDRVRTAKPDNFEFFLGIDQNTIDQRLISGQGADVNAVSATSIQPSNISRIQDPSIKSRTVQDIPNCTTYMTMKMEDGPLEDLEVRQALSYAIDKSSVVKASGGEFLSQVATEMLLPSVPGYEEIDPYATPNHKGDSEKAKELLDEAGYRDGFALTMDVRALPEWQAQAESVQQSLKEIGVTVDLNVIDASTYYQVIGTPEQQHDLAITGWCSGWLNGDALLSPLFSGDRINETGNYNQSLFDNDEVNKALKEAAVMTEPKKQQEAYQQINKMIMKQAPVVPLVRATPLQVVGPNVAGAFSHPGQTGYVDYTSLGLKSVEG